MRRTARVKHYYSQAPTHAVYIQGRCGLGQRCTARIMLPQLRSSCPERSLRLREETLAGMSPRQPGGEGSGSDPKEKKT